MCIAFNPNTKRIAFKRNLNNEEKLEAINLLWDNSDITIKYIFPYFIYDYINKNINIPNTLFIKEDLNYGG